VLDLFETIPQDRREMGNMGALVSQSAETYATIIQGEQHEKSRTY
jgi:hypothetical protein